MAMDPYEIEIRRKLGLDVPVGAEEGRDYFQPIRTFFGATQGVVPRALSGLFPETYAKAQRETAEMLGVEEGAPWYERVEAAPGAGDVLAAAIPEEVRRTAVARAVEPAARIVGNILGDPTTYTPVVLGKAANLIAKGSARGAQVLEASEKAVQGIEEARRVGAATAREAAQALRTAEALKTQGIAKALAEESPVRARAYMAAQTIREAEPYAMAGAAALGYGKQVAEGLVEGVNRTREAIGEGNVEEALVSGANSIFMAGLGGLMAKGVISIPMARRAITRKLQADGVIPEFGPRAGEPQGRIPSMGLAEEAGAIQGRMGRPGPIGAEGFVRVPEIEPLPDLQAMYRAREGRYPGEVGPFATMPTEQLRAFIRQADPQSLERQLAMEELLSTRGLPLEPVEVPIGLPREMPPGTVPIDLTRMRPPAPARLMLPAQAGEAATGRLVEVPEGGIRGRVPATLEERLAVMRQAAEEPMARAREAQADRVPGEAAEGWMPAEGVEPIPIPAEGPPLRPAPPIQKGLPLEAAPPEVEAPLPPEGMVIRPPREAPPAPVTPEVLAGIRERARLEATAEPLRRPRGKGKQIGLPFEGGEPIRSIAEQRRLREETEVRRAYQEQRDEVEHWVDVETKKILRRNAQAELSGPSKRGAAAINRAFKNHPLDDRPLVEDPNDPVWTEMLGEARTEARTLVNERLTKMVRTATKPEHMPAERLAAMRADRLEREGMQGVEAPEAAPEAAAAAPAPEVAPAPRAEVSAPPAPTEAPPAPVEAAPPPAAPTPEAPPARPPSTPEERVGRTVEQWADHVIANTKRKDLVPVLEANRPRFLEKIREAQARWENEHPGSKSVAEIDVGLRAAAHRAADNLAKELEAGREVPPEVPTEGVLPGGKAGEQAGERGAEQAGLTVPGGRAPGLRETHVGPGGLGKAAVQKEKARAGETVHEPTRQFLAGMAKAAEREGTDTEGVLRKFVEMEEADSRGRKGKGVVLREEGDSVKRFNKDRAEEALFYLQALDRLKGEERYQGNVRLLRAAAIDEALVEVNKARKARAEAQRVKPVFIKRPALLNNIGHIERVLGPRLIALEAEARGVVLGRAAETPFDLARIRPMKEELNARGVALAERWDPQNPEEVVAYLRDYAAYKEQAPKGPLGRGEQEFFSDKVLHRLAQKMGVRLRNKINTWEVLERMARAVGLDYGEIAPRVKVPRPAPGAERPAAPAAPAGWKARPLKRGEPVVWESDRGTEVSITSDKTGVINKSKGADELRVDIAQLVAGGHVDRVTFGETVPKGWMRATERLVDKNQTTRLFSVETKENGRETLIVDRGKAGEHPVVALMADKPEERLTYRERKLQAEEYLEDEAKGLDLGDEMVVVGHDRAQGLEFAARTRELGKETARAAKGVVERLVGLLEPKTKVVFRGLTTSPYARGLYVDYGGKERIFLNLADAVYASKTQREAAENMAHALVHEVAHVADVEHKGAGFETTHQYIENLVKAQGIYDEIVESLDRSLDGKYEAVKRELGEGHREARAQLNGESWRARAAEAEAGLSAGPAEGRAAAEPGVARGGAEAAAGGRGGGLRRGGAVPGGVRGPAGDLRPTAYGRQAAAPGPAEGVAARPEAWSDLGESEAGIARLESKEEVTESEAQELINHLGRVKGISLSEQERYAMDMARKWGETASDAEVQAYLKTAPDPRGREGVRKGAINMLVGIDGVPDRVKAILVKYGDVRKGMGIAESSRVRRFEDVSQDVRDLLGIHTREEYVEAFRKRGGGLDDTEELLLRSIRDSYVRDATSLGARWEEAARAGREAEASRLFREYEKVYQNGAATAAILMDRLTGTARGLAEARWKGLVLDPVALRKVRINQQLIEYLRARTGDIGLARQRAAEMMRAIEEYEGGKITDPEFLKLWRAMIRKPGILGGRAAEWRDRFLEFFKAGLLGWPSEAANALSNTGFRGSRYLEDALGAVFDAGFHKMGWVKDRAIFIDEAGVAARALKRALREGLPELAGRELGLLRLKGGDFRKLMQSGALLEDLMGSYGAIPGKFGNFIRFHFDSMQAWDDFFKKISRTDTTYREVFRALKGAGGEGVDWIRKMQKPGEKLIDATERIAGEIEDAWVKLRAGKPYNDDLVIKTTGMMSRADDMARQDTFQARLGNAAAGVQSFLAAHPSFGYLIPFFRTPTNILKETLARTPIGYYEALKSWNKLSQAERMQALAKPTLGTLAMGLFATMALDNEITGGGPLSFEEREALQATGWQPYSARVGNQWVSYQRLEPVSSLMGMAADAVEAYRRGDMQTGAEMLQKGANSLAENLLNKTFWSGLSSLAAATSDPKRELPNFLKQFESSLVPNSLGMFPFGHLTRAIDPIYRQQEPWYLTNRPDPMMAKLPFLSQTLPPAYGPTGEERVRPGSAVERAFSPFARRTVEVGPLSDGAEELVRVGAVPKVPMREWTSPQGFKVPLRPEERQLLAKALQDATKLLGERLMKDPFYQRLPKDEDDPNYVFGQRTQQDMAKAILGKYRSRALKQIMPALKARTREIYREART